MQKQISILGTGWLGLPLAISLLESGFVVKGSTTSKSKLDILKKHNIQDYRITLGEERIEGDISSFLKKSTILIINIPPGIRRNPSANFVKKIQCLIPYIEKSTVKNVIFVSSTSVFSNEISFPIIDETALPNASSNSGIQLIETEKLLQQNPLFNTTIVRFSGLFNQARHPAHMLSKKKFIENAKAPVNLIHLEDCIGIIKKIIETDSWNTVFNASYPYHPKKVAYYTKVCEKMGLEIPSYDNKAISKGKIISSEKIIKQLQYQYIKPL